MICADPAECGITKTRLFQPVFFWSPCSFSCCAQSSFQGSVDSIISISSPPSTHCWCECCECCPGLVRSGCSLNLLTGRLWKERGAGCIRSDCQHQGAEGPGPRNADPASWGWSQGTFPRGEPRFREVAICGSSMWEALRWEKEVKLQTGQSQFPGWEDKGMKVASLGAVPVDTRLWPVHPCVKAGNKV